MATPTYRPLATVTLGSSASSVTFSSIPATYRDIVLIYDVLATSNSTMNFRVNGSTASVYNIVYMSGQGTSTVSAAATETAFYLGDTNTAIRTAGHATLLDYSATDKHKTQLSRWGSNIGAGTSQVWALAGRWADTTAVNTIRVATPTNFAAGSTFSIYGVIA